MVEQYTDMQVMGAIHRKPELTLEERHLGLTPSNEVGSDAERSIERLADIIEQSIDIDKIIALPDSPLLKQLPQIHPQQQSTQPQANLRIAYARDEAFGFYYPDDLQRFAELGVELVAFDCCNDDALPKNIDGLFIGGGFPESRIDQLSINQPLLKDIRQAIENGLPTYAECGGLMYLCQELVEGNTSFPLCGVIPATVTMNSRPQGRGYVVLEARQEHPWITRDAETKAIQAHEFHYSSLSDLPPDTRYAYTVKRGTGIDAVNDGILMYNLLASYVHLRQTDRCRWVDQFISFVNQCKRPAKS
jgi:cobyrinic acid a,c-diamide synthase